MAVAALAACGKKEAEPAQTALPNPNTSNQEMAKAAGDVLKQISPQAAQQPTSSSEANLPSAERGKSLSDYQPLKSGVQLAYLYYALSGLPVDDERLAGIISADYRSTSDSFKKADILKVLKPQMEQQIADLRKNPYLKLHVEGAQLGHYDMSAKSFPIEGLPLAPDAYMSFNDASSYQLAITNGDAFRNWKVEDETKAREVEGLVNAKHSNGLVQYAGYPTPADVYLFAQGVDQNRRSVKFQIVQVTLSNRAGGEVAVLK